MEFLGHSWSAPLLVVGVVGAFLLMWGIQMRSTQSPGIQNFGSLLWYGSLAVALVQNGVIGLVIFALGTGALAAIFSRVIPRHF